MHLTLLPLALLLTLTSALPHRPDVTGFRPTVTVTGSRPEMTGSPQVTGAPRPHHSGSHDSSAAHSASYDKRSSAAADSELSQITITLVNSMKSAVSTSATGNAGAALLTGAGTGTMAPGATASIVAPRDWAGNVAFGLAQYNGFDSPSLVEAGLSTFPGASYMMDIDVSYV